MNFFANTKQNATKTHRRGTALIVLLVIGTLLGALAAGAQAAGHAKTRLSLSAPTSVTAGASVSMTGTLSVKKGGHGLPNRKITLYAQQSGSGDFVAFGSTKTGAKGAYSATVTMAKPGTQKVMAIFAGAGRLGESKAESGTITVAAAAPAPITTPKPVAPKPTSPTPAPNTPVFPADPVATNQTIYPVQSSSAGIIAGEENCETAFGNEINVTQPTITSPTGTFVYAIDKLWARPTGVGDFQLDTSGEQFFSGTYDGGRPVYDWANLRTGQAVTSAYLDHWGIKAGYEVHITQFIWMNGVWYYQNYGACSF